MRSIWPARSSCGTEVPRAWPSNLQSALAKIKVKDSPLTFRLGDRTLTMFGARVLAGGEPLSAVGHWIVGPADLQLVIAP